MKLSTSLISVATATFLIGCGSSSSSNKETPKVEKNTLKKLSFENKFEKSIEEQVSSYSQKGYYEMGDSRIVSLSGNEKYIIAGNKWHNGLSIVNNTTKEAKFIPFAALKSAGHNKVDSSSGATEAVIDKIEISNSNVYVNIPKTQSSKTKIPGLYKVDINEDGGFKVDLEQIKSNAKTPEGESYKNFSVSNDGSRVVAYDGSNLVSFDENLKELASKEAKVISYDFSKNKFAIVYKDGTKVYLSINNIDKLFDLNKDLELNFEPNFFRVLEDKKIVTVEESDKKPIKLSFVDINTKKIVTTEIKEILGTRYIYDISKNGRFLAIANLKSIKIISLYSNKPEVLKTITTNRTRAIDFVGDNKLVYSDGNNNIVTIDIKEGGVLTSEDLISMKLEKLTKVELNNGLPFTEVRKDMDFSLKKLYDSIDLSYEPTGLLTNYLKADGKFIQPEKTVSGKLKIKGVSEGKVGVKEVDLTLLGKDIKDTVVFDDEVVVNTITYGKDKVIFATNKGFRTYKIIDNTFEQIGSLNLLKGIDELVTSGTFSPVEIYKLNENTILGLGKKFTGKSVKIKGRRGDYTVKVFDTKIFKATIKADGMVDTENVEFIDVGNSNISNIDVSSDKKILAILFTPSPKFIEDVKNVGYKKYNNKFTSALVYDLVNNSIKTNTFEIKRDCNDFDDRKNCNDRSAEDVISLNKDGSKILISEGHHGILKLYKSSGELIDDAPNATGELNHMPSHYIIGDKIIGLPLKGSKFYTINITGNSIDTLIANNYPSGKAWANKGTLFGDELHIPNSNRYIGGNPSILKYNINTNVVSETIYKIYNGEVAFSDVDYLSNKVILTGQRVAGRGGSVNINSAYLNIQNKK